MHKLGMASPEEREACIKLYRKLLKTFDGEKYEVILNTLVFVVADIATDTNLGTKQEFIATVVEQLSGAYDTCVLLKSDAEGETQ